MRVRCLFSIAPYRALLVDIAPCRVVGRARLQGAFLERRRRGVAGRLSRRCRYSAPVKFVPAVRVRESFAALAGFRVDTGLRGRWW